MATDRLPARVLCFGEALIDFLAAPTTDNDAPRAYLRHAGGAPANVAVALARLGGDAAFVGMIGADPFGDFLVDALRQHDVDVSHVRRTSAANTALAFVTNDANGERSFSFYRSPAADQLYRAEHFDDAMFAGAVVFHACSNTLTDDAIADATFAGLSLAARHGLLVSFDMNLRPALWREDVDPLPRIWRALLIADVVKLSGEELQFLAGVDGDSAAVLTRLWSGAAQLVVVTHGAGAPHWFTRDAHGTVPPIAMRAIDTTAAGDAFVGGLLHELARHHINAAALRAFVTDLPALDDALCFATACGALSVTRRGAFSAMPALGEVAVLVREQRHGSPSAPAGLEVSR
jgi:fructokinase